MSDDQKQVLERLLSIRKDLVTIRDMAEINIDAEINSARAALNRCCTLMFEFIELDIKPSEPHDTW